MTSQTQDLVDAFEGLSQSLLSVSQLLQTSNTQGWLMTEQGENISLSNAHSLITNIWYQDKGDGRRTQNLYGLIGIQQNLFDALTQLNSAKQRFQSCVKGFKHRTETPSSLLKKRAELLSESLQRQGLARLHLKQCYRQIPLLHSHPTKVGFSWYTSGRSIKKISVKTAEERLLKLDIAQKHIQLQLQALGRIPSSEMLAQLQTQVPVMRANIAWKENEQWIRKARNCPLPLFFLIDDKRKFPEYNVPPSTPPEQRTRITRSDLVIEPEPFLPSLRIHRYSSSN